MGPRFKVSSERPEKRGIDHEIPGLIVQLVIPSITAAPALKVVLMNVPPYLQVLIEAILMSTQNIPFSIGKGKSH